jgi:hypothetical protein
LTSVFASAGSDAEPGNDSAPAANRFRFFDNREKYLLFVTTCSEKWAIAE